MRGKQHTPEQIIRKLREAEGALAEGLTTGDVLRKLGITELSASDECTRHVGLNELHETAQR